MNAGQATIHNTTYATKIIFNPSFSAVIDLKNQMETLYILKYKTLNELIVQKENTIVKLIPIKKNENVICSNEFIVLEIIQK